MTSQKKRRTQPITLDLIIPLSLSLLGAISVITCLFSKYVEIFQQTDDEGLKFCSCQALLAQQMDRMVALEHGSCEHLPTTSVKQLRSDSCLTLKYLTPENSSDLTPENSLHLTPYFRTKVRSFAYVKLCQHSKWMAWLRWSMARAYIYLLHQ